jgi:hypothetical protein
MTPSKRDVGTIMRRVAKRHGFRYYSGFVCCNSCFSARLEEDKVKEYVYLRHCTKGMNYTPPRVLDSENVWYFAYDLGRKSKAVFLDFKEEMEGSFPNVFVSVPHDEHQCLALVRWREGG